jgi:hypothetical protein
MDAIIIVRNGLDSVNARYLSEKLAAEYGVKASVMTPEQYRKDESSISNRSPLISVGGKRVNSLTKELLDVLPAKIDNEEYSINFGFNKVVLNGKGDWKNTNNAVKYFVEHFLADFVGSLRSR